MDQKEVIDFNDYDLSISLAFTRQEGDSTVDHEVTIHRDGDSMQTVLPVMRDFLVALGFEWVGQLAIMKDGDVIFITE